MSDDARLKRLRIRSWRRGTREMDMILGPFADRTLGQLDPTSLDAFEALLVENDHDLYYWVSGRADAPAEHEAIIARIRSDLGTTT